MRATALILAGLLLLAGVVFLVGRNRNGSQTPVEPPAAASSAPGRPASSSGRPPAAATRTHDRSEELSGVVAGSLEIPAPAASEEEKQKRFDAIQAAATTYAPEGIAPIRPYLLDPDPEIRTAAKDGLVTLGEEGGAQALRAAAKQIKDPREAAKYLSDAEWLELPPEPARQAPSEAPVPEPQPQPDSPEKPQ